MGYPLRAVVAMARNRVIGDGKGLLWHLPGDLPRVKSLTMNKPLIMGRKTFESIGKPLEGRANIVLTRNQNYEADGIIKAHDADDAIGKARAWIDEDTSKRIGEIIIFGGGYIYEMFLDRTDQIDLTEIDLEAEGGVRFPELLDSDWTEVSRQDVPSSEGVPGHAFVRLERKYSAVS